MSKRRLFIDNEHKRNIIRKYRKKIERFVSLDPKTGTFNFRYFEHNFYKEFEFAKNNSNPLSLMIIDIDYFKSVNDAYGFVSGDKVLRQLADLIKTEIRSTDTIIRYGGEEFAIVMPDTNFPRAHNIAENIINKVSGETFGDYKAKIKITVSIGLCSYPKEDVSTSKDIITKAEQALSLSKEKGGNNVYVFPYKIIRDENGKKHEIIELSVENKKEQKLTFKDKKSLMEFVNALANTVKAKDYYTQEHSELMSKVAVELARRLGMPDAEIETIKLGAMLHDLGKIGINESILLKPGKLTNEEYELVKQHPQIGAEIVRTVHALKDTLPLILYHHERFDGSGYLKGLKAEEIPIGARIIGIADVYQALRSDRPYRKSYSKEEALEIIKEGSGKQFDPKLVDALLELAKNKYV